MADLYKDFVFARLAATLDASGTTPAVDSTDQLPSNTTLAKGDFWCTLESTLAHPPTFEIVKLTAVNTSTKVVTIARAQAGTAGVAHDPGTYLKGSLTADMLRRIRAGRTGSALPTADDTLFDIGERFTVTPAGQQFIYIGTAAGGWEPVSFVRTTSTITTGSLANGARVQTTIPLATGYRLFAVDVTRKARIRLYATAAQQAADATRPFATDPTGNHGVMLDYSITAAPLKRYLSPVVDGINLETTPVSDIPMTVDNQDTVGTISVTCTWIRTE